MPKGIVKHNMKFRVVMVNLAMAQDFLNRNHPNNRAKKWGKISTMSRDMRGGTFELTHQPLGFDVDGYMIDGQNRMEALCMAAEDDMPDIEVPFVVATNCPRRSKTAIDLGTSRNICDMAKISGEPLAYGSNLASAGRRMMSGCASHTYASNAEVLRFIDNHKKALEFSFESSNKKHVPGLTQAGVRAAIARAWYRKGSHERLKEFMNVLLSGLPNHVRHDSGAIRLRNWLLDNFTSGLRAKRAHRPNPAVVFAKTQAAIDHFLNNETVEQLKETNQNLFPLPGETKGEVMEEEVMV